MYNRFKVEIHIPSLIMHNGQTADPLNPYTKSMKEITGLKKKTDADHKRLADLEYEAGLYLNKKREVIIPSRVLEATLVEGAKKSKESKDCLSSTFVDTDAIITYEGGPLSVAQLKQSPDHRLVCPVRVQRNKIIRTRPIFHNVNATFEVSLQTELANPAQLKRWLENALRQVGIGDWRPRHGRGELRKFEEIKAPVSAIA